MKRKIILFLLICVMTSINNIGYAAEVEIPYDYVRHNANFRDMAMSENGTIVAVGTNGKISVCQNNTWHDVEYPVFDDINDIEYGNGSFYATSDNMVISSLDGIIWDIVKDDLAIKNGGIFYFNGEQFVIEIEETVVNDKGMMVVSSSGVFVTNDFTHFEKVAKSPNSIGKSELFSGFENANDVIPITKVISILYGMGTTNNRNAHRKIEILQNSTDIKFPVDVDDIMYFGVSDERYEIFYISNYQLVRAITPDFIIWDEEIIELDDASDHLSSIDIIYNDGYYLKYDSTERYGYGRVKKCSYTLDFTDFSNVADVTEENGVMYSFDELYFVKNNSIYKCYNSNVEKSYSVPNDTAKNTIKYSNGKYVKWIYENGVSIYLSDDGVDWNIVNSPDIVLTNRCNVEGIAQYDMIWNGSYYIVRPTSCDNGYNPTGEKGSLFICDKDLNLLNTLEFDNYILDMSFEDGKYNVLTNVDGLLHSSTDLVNWETQGTDMTLPLTNNKTSIAKQLNKAESGYSISDYQTKIKIKDVFNDVVFENYIVGDIIVSDGHYIKMNENNISLSDDGAYWHTIQLPDGVTSPRSVYVENNTLYVKNSDVDLRYDITNLYSDVHTYVEVEGKILGFDVEPVIESDRTLVPIRFIFETLGADVDWEDTTRTAIVQNDEATILFSIDDTTASVNSISKTMDVPARLVNDKTMVPLRFLSEELGFNVEWDEETRTATISK